MIHSQDVLPALPGTGGTDHRAAGWAEAGWPASRPARWSEPRCPPAWRWAGSGRTDPGLPARATLGRSTTPGLASSPLGWNSALEWGQRKWRVSLTDLLAFPSFPYTCYIFLFFNVSIICPILSLSLFSLNANESSQ